MSARSLNKVMLIGNLTRDPETRYIPSGAAVCSFGIATNKTWKDANNEPKESVDFHNIVAWGKFAEVCGQLLAKGMKVYVEGSLSTRNWDDDKGVTHYRTEVRINDMIILDSRGKYGAGGAGAEGGEAVEEGGSSKSAEDLLDEMSDSGAEAPAEDGKSGKKSSGKSKKKEEDPLEDMPF